MTSLSDDREQMEILLASRKIIQDEIDELKAKIEAKRQKIRDKLLKDIRDGKRVTSAYDAERDLALKALKYRGLIKNTGTRINPVYVIVDESTASDVNDQNREKQAERMRADRKKK